MILGLLTLRIESGFDYLFHSMDWWKSGTGYLFCCQENVGSVAFLTSGSDTIFTFQFPNFCFIISSLRLLPLSPSPRWPPTAMERTGTVPMNHPSPKR